MQLHYSYYYHQSALDSETCKKIIKLGTDRIAEEKSQGKSTAAYTFGDKQKDAMPDALPQGEFSVQQLKNQGINEPTYVRDSEVAWLNDDWLYETILPYIHEANRHNGWLWDIDSYEAFQFTVYHPSGFYGWHKDGYSDHFGANKRYISGINPVPLRENGSLPPGYVRENQLVGKVRKISCTINLNEPNDYTGGNLKFDFGQHTEGDRFYECEEIRPPGSIIVFPSFLDHCVTPIESGTRYSLVLWCLGDPWK